MLTAHRSVNGRWVGPGRSSTVNPSALAAVAAKGDRIASQAGDASASCRPVQQTLRATALAADIRRRARGVDYSVGSVGPSLWQAREGDYSDVDRGDGAHGHLALAPEVRTALLKMSAATIDRVLQPQRERCSTRRQRPGSVSTIRRSIPLRTFSGWQDPPPGLWRPTSSRIPVRWPMAHSCKCSWSRILRPAGRSLRRRRGARSEARSDNLRRPASGTLARLRKRHDHRCHETTGPPL